MNPFSIGDKARVYFREHSIPTTVTGVVTRVTSNFVEIQATDGWTNEIDDNHVNVPYWDAEFIK